MKQETYIYMIGYGSYEESDYTYLTHHKRYSEQKLRKIIHQAVLDILRILPKSYHLNNYQSINDKVIQYLVMFKDFRHMDVQAKWTCFGWPSMFHRKDWSKDRGGNLDKLTRALNRMGYNKERDSQYQYDLLNERKRKKLKDMKKNSIIKK